MNTSEAEFNVTSLSPTTEPTLLLSTLSILSTATTLSPPTPLPPDAYDPQLTIMVVLGLSLLLAGLAAFLAVCRPSSGEEGDTESGCGRGESHRALSSEPQLKVWKRLGSYRRTYNMASFRRPQHRRPHCEREHDRASQSAARQTLQPEASAEPHLTTPCLVDYVTEI